MKITFLVIISFFFINHSFSNDNTEIKKNIQLIKENKVSELTSILKTTDIVNKRFMFKNFPNFTYLHVASYYGNIEIVNLLLKLGIESNPITNSGITPIFIAMINKNIEIVNILFEKGADFQNDIKLSTYDISQLIFDENLNKQMKLFDRNFIKLIQFGIYENNPFLGINDNTTNLKIYINFNFSTLTKYFDLKIFLLDIDKNEILEIKQIKIKEITNFLFIPIEVNKIPKGTYKLFIVSNFYDKNKNTIATDKQFWGKTTDKKMYLIMKN